MSKRAVWLFLSCSLVGFTGCETTPPLNFTPPTVQESSRAFDADLRTIVVTVAQVEEKKGAIDFNMEFSETMPELWQRGLTDALSRSLLFSDAGIRKIDLQVKILEFAVPPRGASMATKVMARYQAVDRSDGTILYSTVVESRYEVPFSFSALGSVRATESISRAVQANISTFLERLATADLPKRGSNQHE
jgi:hypothetical protein